MMSKHPIPQWQRVYMIVLFGLVGALLYADQNLMAPVLSDIAADFGFSKRQKETLLGGVIPTGFYLVGAPAAIVISYMADSINRCKLLFFVVLVGEPLSIREAAKHV